MSSKIAVLGGGAWGTALALTMLRAGHRTLLWARDSGTVEKINVERVNPRYLPSIDINEGLVATTDLAETLDGADCILAATPAQSLRETLAAASAHMRENVPLVICAKGIERDTGKLMSDVARDVLPGNPAAALSGPSFAIDVARGLPTAVTIASADGELAARLAQLLRAPAFRCYSTTDIAGVEAGGALKNVLAIAAGAVMGAGLGASAQAALITRGFVELRRIGGALGARPETLMGLSGLGDLVLTCSSAQSRNYAYGIALGKGETLQNRPLAEGVATAGVASRIAKERGIDAPIVAATDRILQRKLTILEAMETLLSRPQKPEDA